MKVPEQTSPFIWGFAVGALALAMVGFFGLGWVTNGTAQKQASAQADKAVVAALAPICVDKFRQDANVATNTADLKKVSTWQQDTFITKGGWATMPGSKEPNRAVAEACATMLSKK